jgi:phosphodiesterase/alkaline phosphatase D-like protein
MLVSGGCRGWGFFNAYDAATRYNLDFWMHLGDWIYEYAANTVSSRALSFKSAF